MIGMKMLKTNFHKFLLLFIGIFTLLTGAKIDTNNNICADHLGDYCELSISTIEALQLCCHYFKDPSYDQHLLECINHNIDSINQSIISPEDKKQRFLFVTFISSDIRYYASFVLLYNMLHFFAFSHTYDVKILSELTGHDFEPSDRRWNKIKIAIDGLNNWANDYDYLIVFDADILFLRSDFKIDDIIGRNVGKDIIMAEDKLDFANSGMIIIKNSKWSVTFLQRWWELRNSNNVFCDQHALNILSLQLYEENDIHRIGVIPVREMNSQWPPLENFDKNDFVLHLLGEYSEVRVAISKYLALHSVCSDSSVNISIDRDLLLKLKYEALDQLSNKYMDICESSGKCDDALGMIEHICSMESRIRQDGLCKRLISKAQSLLQLSRNMNLREKSLHLSFLWFSNDNIPLEEKYDQLPLLLGSLEDLFSHPLVQKSDINKIYYYSYRANIWEYLMEQDINSSEIFEYKRLAVEDLSRAINLGKFQSIELYQSLNLRFIKLTTSLSKYLLEQDDCESAVPGCEVALDYSSQISEGFTGEMRLLVMNLRNVYNTCSAVFLSCTNDLNSSKALLERGSKLRYYAPRDINDIHR